MKMDCTEALIQMYEVLDNQASIKANPEAEAHVRECLNCQKLVKLDQALKYTVRERGAEEILPLGLASRIRQRIGEQENLSWKRKLGWLLPGRPWGWIGTASAMLIILLAIGVWILNTKSSVVDWFLDEHAEYVKEGVHLDIVSSNPVVVDNWFKQNVGFVANPGRFLLGGFQIIGGKKLEYGGMKSSLSCLKKGDTFVSFYSVPSSELNIENLVVRKIGNKNLWVGSQEGYNIVVWKEEQKNLTCSLVASLPQEELVNLVGST